MSDNKKYYYIKLKDNYFDQDNIKILESVKNGHIYSLIIVKLYLKATKYGGQLKMTDSIPYSKDTVDTLANVINHDVAHVKEAIRLGIELDLITILDSGEIWLTEIQNLIGKSSSEADRIREYRKALVKQPVQMYNKSTPEKEREIKKEKEIKPVGYNPADDILFFNDKDFKIVWSDLMKHRTKLKCGKTDRSMRMLVKRLLELSKTKEEAIDIIDQSIFYGWKTFYELKEEYKKQQPKKYTNTKKYDFAEQKAAITDEEKESNISLLSQFKKRG